MHCDGTIECMQKPSSKPYFKAWALLGMLASTASLSGAVISEILYDPPAGSGVPEFVEIYNDRAVTYDLRGYRLTGPIHFRFPETEASIVAAHGYLVVSGDPEALRQADRSR